MNIFRAKIFLVHKIPKKTRRKKLSQQSKSCHDDLYLIQASSDSDTESLGLRMRVRGKYINCTLEGMQETDRRLQPRNKKERKNAETERR